LLKNGKDKSLGKKGHAKSAGLEEGKKKGVGGWRETSEAFGTKNYHPDAVGEREAKFAVKGFSDFFVGAGRDEAKRVWRTGLCEFRLQETKKFAFLKHDLLKTSGGSAPTAARL